MKRCWLAHLAAALLLNVATGAGAQEEPAGEEKSPLRKAVESSADIYRIWQGDARDQPLERKRILSWNNSVRQTGDLSEGCTSIWVLNGVPQAIACSYSWAGELCDNVQSLAQRPMSAEREGELVWQCQGPGIKYETLAGEKPPAPAAAVRLRQLRSLAERFSVELLGWTSDNSDREKLRMLSRHVFRYEPAKDSEVLDGALFEFTQGTDPECVLLLEAVAARDGKPATWRYALVRQTAGALAAEFDGKPVWQAEKDYVVGGFDQPLHQLKRPLDIGAAE